MKSYISYTNNSVGKYVVWFEDKTFSVFDQDHEPANAVAVVEIEKYFWQCGLIEETAIDYDSAVKLSHDLKSKEFLVYDFYHKLCKRYAQKITFEDFIARETLLPSMVEHSAFFSLGKIELFDDNNKVRFNSKKMSLHDSSYYPFGSLRTYGGYKFLTAASVRNALSVEVDPEVAGLYEYIIKNSHSVIEQFGWSYHRSFLLSIGSYTDTNKHTHTDTKQTVSVIYIVGTDPRKPIFYTTRNDVSFELNHGDILVQYETDQYLHGLINQTDNMIIVWTFDKDNSSAPFTPESIYGHKLRIC